MTEVYEFGINLLTVLIDLITLALLAGIFYVIGLALVTMARNRQPRWQNIAYVLIILGAGIALLRWYPQRVIASVREAIQEARPEAQLLREELENWLPALPPDLAATPTLDITGEVIILTTPTPMPSPETPTPPATPPPPLPTNIPSTAAPSPSPTPCMVIIQGVPWPCPPTPPVMGGSTWP